MEDAALVDEDQYGRVMLPEIPGGGLRATCTTAQENEEHSLEVAMRWAELNKAVSLAAMLVALMAGGPVGQFRSSRFSSEIAKGIKKKRTVGAVSKASQWEGKKRRESVLAASITLPSSPLMFHLRRTRPLG